MNERVWVVDDNALILKMLEEILTNYGYEVRTFNHPATVINKLMNYTSEKIELPAVMLVDYYMPDLKGPDLVRTIRELGQPFNRISFIGITSSSEDGEPAEEFTKLGLLLLRKGEFHSQDILIRVMRAQADREKTGAIVPLRKDEM